jgi:hypothetical protein
MARASRALAVVGLTVLFPYALSSSDGLDGLDGLLV